MNTQILNLKKLAAAYQASLEWDYCPEPKKLKEVVELFAPSLSNIELKDALGQNSGRRPDEIAHELASEILKLSHS